MNIAGVVKDWLLIWISYSFFKAPVTTLNIVGYAIAFLAVCYFNYIKFKSMNQETSKKEDVKTDVEMVSDSPCNSPAPLVESN
jgi:mannose/fructose/N-acetylgalactosamine-specific phosphotransferase system component IIC